MTLAVGFRLGPYEVVSLLGAGGMGEVYRARDPRLQREVAVKVLPSHLSDDPDALGRFEREARAVAALSHPNILAIFDVGREGEITYTVTELLEGETLRGALLPGPLPPRRAIEIATALADAVFAAHSRGLVHRDIKPENVFLTSDGVVKILDFGLARDTRRAVATDDTRTTTVADTVPGTVLGTFSYMSPEQARGETADSRSDVFALGSVLYEMLTGDRAFQRPTPADTLAAVLRDEPKRLHDVPSALRAIAARCLEKSPLDRYQTARDLALALRAQSSAALPAGPSAEASAAIDSLAVLPFENTGEDAAFRYLSEGIAENLTRSLSKNERLRVISRSAIAHHRAGGIDAVRAGRDLGVRAVLVGRLTVRGEQLSIDAELVDVTDGRQIWGQRYQRSLADVYSLEEEIARSISEQLALKLSGSTPGALRQSRGPKAEAYQLYLKGRYLWNRRPEKGFLDAPEYFEKSIESDPSFALPYAGLADCYSIFGSWESGLLPPNEAFVKARSLARKAIELNDRSAEAHASMGYVLFSYDWDFEQGERELLRSMALDPGYSNSKHWLSHLLLPLGRVAESENASREALAVDPQDFIMRAHFAWHYFFAGNYDLAIEHAENLKTIISGHFWSPFFSGLAHEQKGELGTAIERLRNAVERAPDSTHAAAALAHAQALAGDVREARRTLEEMRETARDRYFPAYDLAIVHLGLNELDEALRWIERAFDDRSSWMIHLNIDPRLAPLRDRPQFAAVIRRVGLPAVKVR